MSAPHSAAVEGTFDPFDTETGHVRLVTDEDTPSRQTMYLDAPGMSVDERSTHWLTADCGDFVSLEEMK